ncbi:MAG: hypothetical protein EA360_00945 [Balneolaceae bacterium]|nr:MAG: hypothetical protein EA360_00945 [Balneolaceae bacterium]
MVIMAGYKLSPSEKTILRELIFPESFENIVSGTGYPYGVIRDDLIQLINHGFIEVASNTESQKKSFFDSDHIHLFSYKATGLGLKKIEHQ